METAEAVQDIGAPDHTPLKQGVNESRISTLFGSPAAVSKKWDAPAAAVVSLALIKSLRFSRPRENTSRAVLSLPKLPVTDEGLFAVMDKRTHTMPLGASALVLALIAIAARGQDNFEIQVYGSETLAPRESMIELHI
jgi:hypothetical protein